MKQWFWITNPFLAILKVSIKRALKVSTYTHAQLLALKDDEFWLTLFTFYDPIHTKFAQVYNSWKSQGGYQKASTLTVLQLLKLLSSTKLAKWDHKIKDFFDKGSPEYLAIFPNGHYPFHSRYDALTRIQSVERLAEALKDITDLAAVHTEVLTFASQLNTAYKSLQGNKGSTNATLDAVYNAGVDAMKALFKVMSDVNSHNYLHPELTAPIFDLVTLRNHDQVKFTGTILSNDIEAVIHHTFLADDDIALGNDGKSTLIYYLAESETTKLTPEMLSVSVDANQKKIVPITNLGNIENKILMVYNPDVIDGHYVIQIL